MSQFRLDSIAQLARQMEFAPQEVRLAQLDRAETLLQQIEPGKAYPLEFVVYRITDYHPRTIGNEQLIGLALQHDLGMLIERVSNTLALRTDALAEPVLSIDDVCQKFNVTSKTIQRWRRKGLSARRFVFPDGKRRVGFLLRSVERFVAGHETQVAATANVSEIGESERKVILRRARLLASPRCCPTQVTRRIARKLRRSPLTILHIIRKHDQENPDQAVFSGDPGPNEREKTSILRGWRSGLSLRRLARRLNRPRSAIYRVIMDERIDQLKRRKIGFFDDQLFHQSDASQVIESLVNAEPIGEAPRKEDLRTPRDLPAGLADVFRAPLLTAARERALFLKLNFHKCQFTQARRRLDPELACSRDLGLMERHLQSIAETRQRLIEANLRLVVSVARKHLRPGIDLMELSSDGVVTLVRAIEGFDVGRGFRFSTYATWALMKGFARSVGHMLARRRTSGCPDLLESLADRRPSNGVEELARRDEILSLLGRLDEQERNVIRAHFGLNAGKSESYQQLGERLGLSQEHVRRIEQSALAKMRGPNVSSAG